MAKDSENLSGPIAADVEAAAAVNDDSALDTPIRGHEAALTAGLINRDGASAKGLSELEMKTPATMTPGSKAS